MKRITLAAAIAAAAITISAPASAVTYVQSLGNVSVPPDTFFTPATNVVAGSVDAYWNFTLSSVATLSGASFTSTNPGAVNFTSVGIYSGTATAASTGTPAGTRFAFNNVQEVNTFGNGIGYTPVTLAAGTYTIYLTGTAASQNTIGSSIRFSSLNAAAVPEPASWGMMLLGLGMVGAGLRSRRVRFAHAAA